MPPKTGPVVSVRMRSVMNTNRLTEKDRLVKPDEASTLLALSRRTLRRYELAGKLPPVKLNRRVTRYRLADVLRLMELPV